MNNDWRSFWLEWIKAAEADRTSRRHTNVNRFMSRRIMGGTVLFAAIDENPIGNGFLLNYMNSPSPSQGMRFIIIVRPVYLYWILNIPKTKTVITPKLASVHFPFEFATSNTLATLPLKWMSLSLSLGLWVSGSLRARLSALRSLSLSVQMQMNRAQCHLVEQLGFGNNRTIQERRKCEILRCVFN